MKVYYLGNLDGRNMALVAAPTQKEACRLMCCSQYSYRQFGGHATTRDDFVAVAMSEPGRVFHRKIDYGPTPQPWVYASWQPDPPPPTPPPAGKPRRRT